MLLRARIIHVIYMINLDDELDSVRFLYIVRIK